MYEIDLFQYESQFYYVFKLILGTKIPQSFFFFFILLHTSRL
jgi:hypothetical protein